MLFLSGFHRLLSGGGIQPHPDFFCKDPLIPVEVLNFSFCGIPYSLPAAIRAKLWPERIAERIAAAIASVYFHVRLLSNSRYHFRLKSCQFFE